jgi:acyl-CoA dehydrogenase
MATELDAARLLVYRAAHAKDAAPGGRVTLEASMGKMFATEAAQRIIDRGLQLHGGLSVLRGTAVERLYREIRALRIYEGTTEIQRVVIAGALLAGEKARAAAG